MRRGVLGYSRFGALGSVAASTHSWLPHWGRAIGGCPEPLKNEALETVRLCDTWLVLQSAARMGSNNQPGGGQIIANNYLGSAVGTWSASHQK